MVDSAVSAQSLTPISHAGDDPAQAVILNVQRLSTEDGPGIRTTVFFKGCPLSCIWCHNPESIARGFQIQWLETRCIGCLSCLIACPEGGLSYGLDGMAIERGRCSLCLACVEACPADAMQQLGRRVSLADLTADLLKDRTYYENSGGGVTASGGEPTLQAGFVRQLFRELKLNGIHTALDTCGLYQPGIIESLLPYTDLVLFDLKEMDPSRHRQFTGSNNAAILRNLKILVKSIRRDGLPVKIWIRTPLIPGATAGPENIGAISRLIETELAGLVERWELCAFNNLCRDKYARLDMKWQFNQVPLLDQKETGQLLQIARTCGLRPDCVQVTGAARL